MNFCREWGKDSNMNNIQSPLDEVIQKSVGIQSRSPTRVGGQSYYGFNESASIGNRMHILIPVCVDRRGFLSKNPPMRRSLVHHLSRGILLHGLDVVPVTLWVVGIIHVNICSVMFQMLTILLHGLTHGPPFMDGYLGLPE